MTKQQQWTCFRQQLTGQQRQEQLDEHHLAVFNIFAWNAWSDGEYPAFEDIHDSGHMFGWEERIPTKFEDRLCFFFV